MTSSLPDDKKWVFADEAGTLVFPIAGTRDVLKGSATIPPTEVLALFNILDYLATQVAACNAVRKNAAASP